MKRFRHKTGFWVYNWKGATGAILKTQKINHMIDKVLKARRHHSIIPNGNLNPIMVISSPSVKLPPSYKKNSDRQA